MIGQTLNGEKITVERIVKGKYIATVVIHSTQKITVTMLGHTPEISIKKMKLFLEDKPYKHLDNE